MYTAFCVVRGFWAVLSQNKHFSKSQNFIRIFQKKPKSKLCLSPQQKLDLVTQLDFLPESCRIRKATNINAKPLNIGDLNAWFSRVGNAAF